MSALSFTIINTYNNIMFAVSFIEICYLKFQRYRYIITLKKIMLKQYKIQKCTIEILMSNKPQKLQ